MGEMPFGMRGLGTVTLKRTWRIFFLVVITRRRASLGSREGGDIGLTEWSLRRTGRKNPRPCQASRRAERQRGCDWGRRVDHLYFTRVKNG